MTTVLMTCYNWCRVHQTLGATPVMEAGLTDEVWDVEELITLLPVEKAKRGPYKKPAASISNDTSTTELNITFIIGRWKGRWRCCYTVGMEIDKSKRDRVLKYAVLSHGGIDEPHFDFLVETLPGSDLATWRIGNWPVEGSISATRLRDHRRIYLDYQGELTGHRGHVDRIDSGECRIDIGEDAVWTISPVGRPWGLTIRQLSGEQWQAEQA